MEGKCTVFFEDPFWVCICEVQDESGFQMARFVFGSEPGQAELVRFARDEYQHLAFSRVANATTSYDLINNNYKKRRKQAKEIIERHGVGTKAQQAYKLEMERLKTENQITRQSEITQQENEVFSKKMWKKKQKHKGR